MDIWLEHLRGYLIIMVAGVFVSVCSDENGDKCVPAVLVTQMEWSVTLGVRQVNVGPQLDQQFSDSRVAVAACDVEQ